MFSKQGGCILLVPLTLESEAVKLEQVCEVAVLMELKQTWYDFSGRTYRHSWVEWFVSKLGSMNYAATQSAIDAFHLLKRKRGWVWGGSRRKRTLAKEDNQGKEANSGIGISRGSITTGECTALDKA